MCATLTENVVLVRTRSHDLKSVKKLNCWGCALKDVSIVHRMPAVEVISLSINSIESLSDFSECSKLQELYLRKNEIKDINHVMYLTQLECLKKLSLEDNPCTQLENYRLTVVKALPNLEYLDNVRVTPDEIYEAEKYGADLFWPGSNTEENENEEQVQILSNNNQANTTVTASGKSQNSTEYSRHASQQSLSNTSNSSSNPPESGYCQSSADETMSVCSSYTPVSQTATNQALLSSSSSTIRPSTASHHVLFTGNTATSQHYSFPSSQQCEQQVQQHSQTAAIQSQMQIQPHHLHNQHHAQIIQGTPKKTNMSKCTSMSDYALYNNGNGHYRPMSPTQSEYNYDSETVASTIASHRHSAQFENSVNYRQAHLRTSSMSNQNRFLPKGGRNRNANILSAVLCLIKELDYASLEVVDTTIHCRMEEMED